MPFTHKSISNRFLCMAKMLGMKFSAHTWRRSYCTMLEVMGIPLRTISQMMRHRNINDTIRYLARSPMKMLNARRKQKDFMIRLRGMAPENRLEYCLEAVDASKWEA